MAILPQLTSEEIIDLDLSFSEDVTKIGYGAFDYGVHINNLTLGDNITEVPNKSFDNVDHIIITWLEKPVGWNDWDHQYEDKINYVRAEEIEDIKRRKEQEAELERQRQAEAEQNRIEQERQAAIASIRYKKEGKEITILGAQPAFIGDIIIPETIDGLPVTKIAPFAFYLNVKVTSITLPDTIKIIGQGAFAYTVLTKSMDIPKHCVVGKNVFYGAITEG